ncbi:hypothetical protein [Acidisoma silvae]|uniref:Uncharacterized protein n=1 Tax=Acidisoma silvae TaxID=2802396 RepID=A0A963YXZ7_9PROT|nr:hypothetical protein [Acidisoma silvae]MCB8878258.1 hypothetical protein [Acidisoma silvae]
MSEADKENTRRRGAPSSAGAPPERRDDSLSHSGTLAGAFQLIDLDQHPDGELLRLIAQGTNAREKYQALNRRGHRRGKAIADRQEVGDAFGVRMRLECRIINTPAKTPFGLTAKAMFALEHESVADVHASNLTWGVGGLLFSVVNDAILTGALS